MPRPNRPRSIASEDNLARRIAYEREQRQMSYAGLAQRMTERGCAIDQSALYKIEKGEPRRRISVDELVALSEVFAVPIDELLAPPELMAEKVVLGVLQRYREARATLAAVERELFALVDGDDHVKAALGEHLTFADVPPIMQAAGMFFSGTMLSREEWIRAYDAMIAAYERKGRPDLADALAVMRDHVAGGGRIITGAGGVPAGEAITGG